ncbi:MAG TPA: response regulator [Pyrinomonadaceae bacterium]|nr:response regulator [Pyrinomonadaceae bacterium]
MRLEFESNVSTPSLNENGTADSVSETASSQVKALLHDGIKAAQSGNRAEARHLLLRVTELDQKNESAWLWLASISEYPEELLIFLNNVLDVNPENQRALEWMKATKSLLAKTFVQRGIDAHREEQFSFAKQCFFQAVGHDDQNEMAWLWLASVSDLAEEKKSYLDKVLAINPDNEDAKTALESANFGIAQNLCKKANSLAAVGKNDEAAELLEEVFQKAPNLEDAWVLKAHLSPSFDEKFSCFEKVIELNAHNETALAGLDAFRTITQIAAPQVHFEEESFVSEETEVQVDLSQEPAAPSFAEENFAQPEVQFEEKTEEVVEEKVEETVEEKTEEVQEFKEEVQFAPEFSFDNSPTDELELPEAFVASNPFENRHVSPEDQAIHEEIDSFFDALEENKKADESEEVHAEVEEEKFELFADESAQTETAIELSEEQTAVESFTPQHSFDASEEAEETVQFSEGVENDDFEIAEESVEAEASEPQFSQTQEEENLYFQESEMEEPAQEFHHEETAHFEETAEETAHFEETSFEEQPTESHNLADNYSYQNFAHNVETQEAEEYAQPVEETHSEETYQTETHENNQESAPEQFFVEEEVHAEEPKAEFVEEQTEEVQAEEVHQEEPQQFFEEETQAEEVQFEAEEVHAEVVETVFEETVEEVKAETTACPYCSAENEVQAFACGSCRAVLSLSDLEVLLSNNEANEVLLHQAVSRMELEKNLRPFDAEELLYLGIGYVNLKNLRQGFAYLQEAAQMRPDDFLLNSQINALALRVEDIKKQEEAHDAQPKGRTILVVDDSATVRKLISGKLEKCGHEVVCAVDGMDALAKLNEIVPDLILLDITMPRMDGYQVCKLIRNNQATKDIPVVMISGKDGFFDKVRGRMAGTTGYITKPFGPETLMKALDAYIRNGN